MPRDVVRDRVQRLSRLFKHEFRFRADAPFTEIFADTLEGMRAAGELIVVDALQFILSFEIGPQSSSFSFRSLL